MIAYVDINRLPVAFTFDCLVDKHQPVAAAGLAQLQ